MKKYMKVALSLLLVICLLNPGNVVGIYSNPIDTEFTSETKEMGSASQKDAVTLQLSNDCKILQYVDEEVFNAGNHVSRLINEEDFSSYVFLNNDGSKTAYYTDEVVKFRDVNGRICEKDLTLIPGKSGYTTTENDVKLVIPDDPSTGIRISYNGSNVLLIPQGGTTIGIPHIEENSVTYVDYYGQGMSLRYTPTLYGVKEDIVLTSYTGVNSFKFVLNTDGLNLYQINGRFFLAKSVDAVERIELGDIVAFDARGRFSLGTMTTETILPGERYCITVVANKEFLEDASTTYPVSIDPTLTISDNTHGPGAIEDATVYEGTPNLNTGTWQYGHIGYYDSTYGRGHIVCRLTGLLEDDEYQAAEASQISSAKFYIREASGNTAGKVYLYPIYNNSSWTETGITWNNLGAYIGTAYDSVSMASNALVNFNITELVKDWKNNERNPRAGFILDASTLNTAVESVYTSEYTTSSYRPYVVVTYVSEGAGGGKDFASAKDIPLDASQYVSTVKTGEKRYFKFTPSATGSYLFYSTNAYGDPHIRIYNSSQSVILSDDNSGGNGNFRMVLGLNAGSTYYLAAGQSGAGTGSFVINILMLANNISVSGSHLRNEGSSLYIDIHGSGEQEWVHQWTYHGDAQGRWTIAKQSDGYYTIRSAYGNKYYMGVSGTNVETNNIKLYSSISDNTRWKIYVKSTGELFFEPKSAPGKVLYAPNNSSGYELQLTYISSSVASRNKWKIEFQSNTTLEGQRWSNWCWATSARMLTNHYFDVPSTRTQNTAVSAVKGSVINDGGDHTEAIQAASFYRSASTISNTLGLTGAFGSIFNETTLRTFLNEGHVVYIARGWYTINNERRGGHASVIIGYTTIYDSGSIQYMYMIYDPWPADEPNPWSSPEETSGQFYTRSYNWICNGRNALAIDGETDSRIWDRYVVVETSYSGNTVTPVWN